MTTPPRPIGPSLEQLKAARRGGLVRDLWHFMRHNKKWWLLPILACFALFGLLLLLSGTGAAPFIYTVF